jgi:hypothetical protein
MGVSYETLGVSVRATDSGNALIFPYVDGVCRA